MTEAIEFRKSVTQAGGPVLQPWAGAGGDPRHTVIARPRRAATANVVTRRHQHAGTSPRAAATGKHLGGVRAGQVPGG
jgi:hypothetical protein